MRSAKLFLAGVAALGVAGSVAGADAGVAQLEITGTPAEAPSPFAWLLGSADPTLREYVTAIESVADRDDIDALVIRMKDAALTRTHAEELGAAMQRVREEGQRVVLFAEGYGQQEVLLGAYADDRIIQSGGGVFFPGIVMEEMFLADMLGWIGVEAQLVQVGDYKGANEMMTRTEPSEAWNENITGLLDGLYGELLSSMRAGYGKSGAAAERALEEIWFADAETAIRAGMIDDAVDLPALTGWLEEALGDEVSWKTLAVGGEGPDIDTANPFAMLQMLSRTPDHTPKRPTIAILHVDGAIVDGDSSPASAFSSATAGSRTLRNSIERMLDEDLIRGVVVRINSPGGSAIASEVIWQGLQRLKTEKPVWVSVGDMAASGGYYIAVGGDRIYANPSSIVGSIGVVGGKYALAGVYDHMKINVVTRTRGPRAAMFASNAPWGEAERSLIREKMTETYDLFADRVESGRRGIDLSKTAEGRLFTGTQAEPLKMIDEIGGLELAISDLAGELELSRFDVMHYPGPRSFDQLIEQFAGGFGVRAPGGSAELRLLAEIAEGVLGEPAWTQLRSGIRAMMTLRTEPVILTSPRALLFR